MIVSNASRSTDLVNDLHQPANHRLKHANPLHSREDTAIPQKYVLLCHRRSLQEAVHGRSCTDNVQASKFMHFFLRWWKELAVHAQEPMCKQTTPGGSTGCVAHTGAPTKGSNEWRQTISATRPLCACVWWSTPHVVIAILGPAAGTQPAAARSGGT